MNSNFIGITTLHVTGSLSAHHQEFLAYIRIGTFYAVLMTVYSKEQDGTGCVLTGFVVILNRV